MKALPIIISVPHGGVEVPKQWRSKLALSDERIVADGDVGALEIYRPLKTMVQFYLESKVARAIVDLNRPRNDFSSDGVVKTHTCWLDAVWCQQLSISEKSSLLKNYWEPYHQKLELFAMALGVKLGIDCHTMAEFAPPIASTPGLKRPMTCVSDYHGTTCPPDWTQVFADMLRVESNLPVHINRPFQGGYICKSRPGKLPWLQLELSRTNLLSNKNKSQYVINAIKKFASFIEANTH